MDRTEQKKEEKTQVVSPLANEKTYGERWFSRVFDWGLNYWLNLTVSAMFSHWAANSATKYKWLGDNAPREIQTKFTDWISNQGIMQGFKKDQIAQLGPEAGMKSLNKRSFSIAESLTLLAPGFLIMIPTVWLGAKVKPWFVEKLNKWHYGDEAMEDPSLKARHEAIRAEERPTFLGTTIARVATALAVQFSAKLAGSENNLINTIGKKANIESMSKFPGINPTATEFGTRLGGTLPEKVQNWFQRTCKKWNFTWSDAQIENGLHKLSPNGEYNFAAKDASRYMVLDTIYTLITALTIRPFVKILRNIPGMSYKPNVPANSPTFDGEKVKVPANRYANTTPLDEQPLPEPASLDKATPQESPSLKVSHITQHNTLAANDARQAIQA